MKLKILILVLLNITILTNICCLKASEGSRKKQYIAEFKKEYPKLGKYIVFDDFKFKPWDKKEDKTQMIKSIVKLLEGAGAILEFIEVPATRDYYKENYEGLFEDLTKLVNNDKANKNIKQKLNIRIEAAKKKFDDFFKKADESKKEQYIADFKKEYPKLGTYLGFDDLDDNSPIKPWDEKDKTQIIDSIVTVLDGAGATLDHIEVPATRDYYKENYEGLFEDLTKLVNKDKVNKNIKQDLNIRIEAAKKKFDDFFKSDMPQAPGGPGSGSNKAEQKIAADQPKKPKPALPLLPITIDFPKGLNGEISKTYDQAAEDIEVEDGKSQDVSLVKNNKALKIISVLIKNFSSKKSINISIPKEIKALVIRHYQKGTGPQSKHYLKNIELKPEKNESEAEYKKDKRGRRIIPVEVEDAQGGVLTHFSISPIVKVVN